ncbi:hypothetical protein TUN205_10472 [Pyrenophora tritici-repentis]|nr:hypothetical protein TUN205_10472 [Pyrenophora tritici-repentis]
MTILPSSQFGKVLLISVDLMQEFRVAQYDARNRIAEIEAEISELQSHATTHTKEISNLENQRLAPGQVKNKALKAKLKTLRGKLCKTEQDICSLVKEKQEQIPANLKVLEDDDGSSVASNESKATGGPQEAAKPKNTNMGDILQEPIEESVAESMDEADLREDIKLARVALEKAQDEHDIYRTRYQHYLDRCISLHPECTKEDLTNNFGPIFLRRGRKLINDVRIAEETLIELEKRAIDAMFDRNQSTKSQPDLHLSLHEKMLAHLCQTKVYSHILRWLDVEGGMDFPTPCPTITPSVYDGIEIDDETELHKDVEIEGIDNAKAKHLSKDEREPRETSPSETVDTGAIFANPGEPERCKEVRIDPVIVGTMTQQIRHCEEPQARRQRVSFVCDEKVVHLAGSDTVANAEPQNPEPDQPEPQNPEEQSPEPIHPEPLHSEPVLPPPVSSNELPPKSRKRKFEDEDEAFQSTTFVTKCNKKQKFNA